MQDHSPNSRTDSSALAAGASEHRQRNRMILAILLLLVAVAVVVSKDRRSLFEHPQGGTRRLPRNVVTAPEPRPSPANDLTAPDASGRSASSENDSSESHPTMTVTAPLSAMAKAAIPQRSTHPPHPPKALPPPDSQAVLGTQPDGMPSVIATRAVLPPLRVEVVAGDRHSPVKPGNPTLKVDMQPGSPARPEEAAASSPDPAADSPPLTDASERVEVSADTSRVLTRRVRPEYPLLARQMKVQGSVVLDAMIGKDGGIQDLHVVQGPTILADAAREAVRQWRFKPYLQDGQPVETQAHITVNFMISTN
jgi:periplasmic protein TonB